MDKEEKKAKSRCPKGYRRNKKGDCIAVPIVPLVPVVPLVTKGSPVKKASPIKKTLTKEIKQKKEKRKTQKMTPAQIKKAQASRKECIQKHREKLLNSGKI